MEIELPSYNSRIELIDRAKQYLKYIKRAPTNFVAWKGKSFYLNKLIKIR